MIGIFQARGVIVISKAFSPHDVVRLSHIALKFVLVPDAKEFIIMIDNRELSTGCVFNVKAEAEKYVWIFIIVKIFSYNASAVRKVLCFSTLWSHLLIQRSEIRTSHRPRCPHL